MKKLRWAYANKVKTPPGTLPEPLADNPEIRITVIDYSPEQFNMMEFDDPDECLPFLHSTTVSWINIDGIGSSSVIEKIGKEIELHPLVMEDIMNPLHRPKFEEYDDNLFVIFKMIRFDRKSLSLSQEQVSLVLGDNYVITFQEYSGDIFDAVRQRIKNSKGRIRKMRADYLFCSLLDLVVDNYYPILEDFDEIIEDLDESIQKSPRPLRPELYLCQKQINLLHRTIWPVRDLLNDILRSENSLIKERTFLYFRDINDHILQILDLVDSFRDNITSLMELSLAINSDGLNRVMKILTLVSTIFIPLSFIAGLYGMNFRNMPELNTEYGYFVVLGVMLSIFTGMIIMFKKRKWF